MNPVAVALKGKGPLNLVRRAMSIGRNYGVTPAKMDHAMQQFTAILDRFGCGATFPVTATALGRNPSVVRNYQRCGLEFAIHGYRHVDHCLLTQAEQQAQLELARRLFERIGTQVQGFRGPYLHANLDTLGALERQGLAYDSSQGLSWDVLDSHETPAYRHVLGFYGALSASDYPSLPSLEGSLVRIPYSLPDDEALVHRLSLTTIDQMSALWLAILRCSYERGELFTLGLHPERIFTCQEPLVAVLSEARQLDPPVWIVRLDEIAAWWRARTEAAVGITDATDGRFHLTVAGPSGTTVLARAVEVDVPTAAWVDGYRQVNAMAFTVCASLRPFIGLSPVSSPNLVSFLCQQGYLVEFGWEPSLYSYYFDQAEFSAEDRRPLLAKIEKTGRPLVRLGRWPRGARSALVVTGDIDALTLWDYGLRILGR